MQQPTIPLSSLPHDVTTPMNAQLHSVVGSPTFTNQTPQNRFIISEHTAQVAKNVKRNRPMTYQTVNNMINTLVTPKAGSTFRSNSNYTNMLRNEQNKGLKSDKNFKAFLKNMEETRIQSETRLEDTVKLIKEHESEFKALKKQQKQETKDNQERYRAPEEYLGLKQKDLIKKKEYTQNAIKNQKEKSYRIIRNTLKNIQYDHTHEVQKYIFSEKISNPHHRTDSKKSPTRAETPNNFNRQLSHTRSLINPNGLPNLDIDDLQVPLDEIDLDPMTKFNKEQLHRLQQLFNYAVQKKKITIEHNSHNKPHFYSDDDKKFEQIRKIKEKLGANNQKIDLKDINLFDILTNAPDMYTSLGAGTLKTQSKKSLMQRIKAQQPIDDFLKTQSLGLDLETNKGRLFMTTNFGSRQQTPSIMAGYKAEGSFFPTQPVGKDTPRRLPRSPSFRKSPSNRRSPTRRSESPAATLSSVDVDPPEKVDKRTATETIAEILDRPLHRPDTQQNLGRAEQLFKQDKKGRHIRRENPDIQLRERYNMALDTYGSPRKMEDLVMGSRNNFFNDKIEINVRPNTAKSVMNGEFKKEVYHELDLVTRRCEYQSKTTEEIFHEVQYQVNYIQAGLEKIETTLTGHEKLTHPPDVIREVVETHNKAEFIAGKDYFLTEAQKARIMAESNKNITVGIDVDKLEKERGLKKENIELEKKAKEKAQKINLERLFIRTGKRFQAPPEDPIAIRKNTQNRGFLFKNVP